MAEKKETKAARGNGKYGACRWFLSPHKLLYVSTLAHDPEEPIQNLAQVINLGKVRTAHVSKGDALDSATGPKLIITTDADSWRLNPLLYDMDTELEQVSHDMGEMMSSAGSAEEQAGRIVRMVHYKTNVS